MADILNNIAHYASAVAIIMAFIGSAKYIFYLVNKDDLNVIFATASQNDFDRFIGTILVAIVINSIWNVLMFGFVKNHTLTIIYGFSFGISFLLLLESEKFCVNNTKG
ncbi:hypothetical protein OYT88_19890 [Sporolactobacillus sp. CQH2019]|uniref:hypothetical protein n=1 Tax=Sporolactobacillus sp. CQH2019 TaxID=3023512 RepID=UPI002367C5CE|nr:hypothetical protein [Sporolactobacillus sp. CQH2019]MDD9150784.1 hypothetical protein [Sporolactobacillus sp. CQH2019]